MFIVCDDTFIHRTETSPERAGIGCLLMDEDSCERIVAEALGNLEADSDLNKYDRRLLQRGYFHASEDSKNAHSWLCRSIHDHLDGEFNYIFLDTTDEDPKKVLNGTLQYLGIMIASSREPVKVQIERNSSLSEAKIQDVLSYVSRAIAEGAYNNYAIPSYFPKVELEIVDKRNTGIQVVDFILWAYNRSKQNPPNPVWLSRLGAGPKIDIQIAESKVLQGGMYFKKPIRTGFTRKYPQEIFPLAEFEDADHVVALFQEILQTLVPFINGGLPAHLSHIDFFRRELIEALQRSDFLLDSKITEQIASLYLRLFDMHPLFSESDKTDVQKMRRLLQTKRLAGLILDSRLIHGVRTRLFLTETFRTSIKNNSV